MATVFQMGDVQIFKDLIFGWTLLKEGQPYFVEEMALEVLDILAGSTYPAYLKDFHRDVILIREQRRIVEEKEKAETKTAFPELDQEASVPKADPVEESIQLIMDEITRKLRNAGDREVGLSIQSNPPYCYVRRRYVAGTEVGYDLLKQDHVLLSTASDIRSLAKAIARRWW